LRQYNDPILKYKSSLGKETKKIRTRMERDVNLFIALILQCIILSSANQNLVPVFVSEMGSFLGTETIEIVMEESVFDCVHRCVNTPNCKSINYRRKGSGNNCYLNKKNRREESEEAMITDDNFIHYDVDYHTQRSEEPEFGTTNIHMPTVPPMVKPRLCDSYPCQNGGTCVEIFSEDRFQCNCTDKFVGDTCEQRKPGGPVSGDEYDFELVFQSANTANYVEYIIQNYASKMTVCSWIFTKKIADAQKMTVWSIKTPEAAEKVLNARIDGTGGFFFSWGDQESNHPNHFPKNPVDRWIYLCVIIVDSSTTLEAIVDADYSSKVLSNAITQPFNNVRLTRLIIGQEQKNNLTDPSFTPEYAFEGRMADLNIWQWNLDEYHVNRWFQGKSRNERPIVAWNTLGYPDKRFGDVHFVSITSAFGRVWREVEYPDFAIDNTSNVLVTPDGNGVNITLNSPTQCSGVDVAPVDAVIISVPGNWKRIKLRQTFMETQQCYAVFGSVPSWAPANFPDPGIEEFDFSRDEIYETYLGGVDVHQYSGVNTLCGDQHFWAVNNMHPNDVQSEAGLSLRRKIGASKAGISTYGKCGTFTFRIRKISVLEG